MKGLLKGVLRSERGFVVALAVLSTPGMAPELDAQDARPSLYQPTASPDGSEIAFVSSGEIWTAPSTGGVARILVAHEADESAPLYSPDGTRLAFVSNRAGDNDVYVMELTSGNTFLMMIPSTKWYTLVMPFCQSCLSSLLCSNIIASLKFS